MWKKKQYDRNKCNEDPEKSAEQKQPPRPATALNQRPVFWGFTPVEGPPNGRSFCLATARKQGKKYDLFFKDKRNAGEAKLYGTVLSKFANMKLQHQDPRAKHLGPMGFLSEPSISVSAARSLDPKEDQATPSEPPGWQGGDHNKRLQFEGAADVMKNQTKFKKQQNHQKHHRPLEWLDRNTLG